MKFYRKIIKDVLHKKGFILSNSHKISGDIYQVLYLKDSLDNKRFYNIGAGSFYHQYWTNIDYATDYYSQYQKSGFINHNLMTLSEIPVEANIAELVYTSHTIEHISEDAVKKMFMEVFRILKTKGGFRVTAPNAWLDYRAYINNDLEYFFWYKRWFQNNNSWMKNFSESPVDASIGQLFLTHVLSPRARITLHHHQHKLSDIELKEIIDANSFEQAMNLIAKNCQFDEKFAGNHISWWTPEKVMYLLKEAGFSKVYVSAYAQSAFTVMRDLSLFDNTMPYVSFYVEAIK